MVDVSRVRSDTERSSRGRLCDEICARIGFPRKKPGKRSLTRIELEILRSYLNINNDLVHQIRKRMEREKRNGTQRQR